MPILPLSLLPMLSCQFSLLSYPNKSENLALVKKNALEKFEQIKIIWTSPLIPLDPIVMRKDLTEATKKKIKDFFLKYGTNDPEEQAVLVKMGNLKGFKESTDAQLIPIRQLEFFSQRNKIEADSVMSESDKKIKLAEIDGKLEALKK